MIDPPAELPPIAPPCNTPQPPLRIALRLWNWAEWCRQVIRGVQSFAHSKPNWRIYVHAGSESMEDDAGQSPWDGIITAVLTDNLAAWRRIIAHGRTKVVSITSAPPMWLKGIPNVRIDDLKIARLLGHHLLAGGFRRLAYCRSGPSHNVDDRRISAIRAFAETEGCPFQSHSSGVGGTFDKRSLLRWIIQLPKPIGIVTWNMINARHVAEACRQAGIPIPAQVAIVSWDDDPLLAETVDPTLSGMVLPAERLGHDAALLLDCLISGQPAPLSPLLIEPSGIIHVRQSSDVSTLPDRDVYLAAQFIREHAAEPLRVPDVLKALGVSRSKLERNFLRVTGQTLNQAIVQAHIERARQLLIETDWPLERLAERAGFGTRRHFDRAFLLHQGITPATYRLRFAQL